MALRYLAPALAVAGQALAQQCSGTTTIHSQAQATQLASCGTYNGDIWIAPGTTDDISLDGIQRIEGGLMAKNVLKMTSLSADSLTVIGDTFGLENIQTLTSLNFPELINVDSIIWSGLPNLQGLSFTQNVQKANILSIQNTELSSLEGIDLQVIDTLVVANNPYLDTVNMQLGNVSNALSFASNGQHLNVDFPNLEWAYNMTFRNCSSVKIPSLASVNGSLGFYSNMFDSLMAPNLTAVGGSLSFVSNPDLTKVEMPELKAIGGGFQIANNTHYKDIDGFNRLADVQGAVDMYGVMSSVTLPALNLVKGAFNIQSTANIDKSCAHFKSIAGPNNDIRGQFSCYGNQAKPGGKGTKSPGTNASGGGSSSSSGATSLLVPFTTGFIGFVAVIFGML